MFAGRPIIGIVGGIGSGKSFVADLFQEFGCFVIHSDDLVHQAYAEQSVLQKLRGWWGDEIIDAKGQLDRRAVARKVFDNEIERKKLEGLIHPLVGSMRDQMMENVIRKTAGIVGFVWDTPLLFEANLNADCDAVVFVEAPLATRLARVQARGGWDEAELLRRENLQWPLDKKREMADYIIRNTADAAFARDQVKQALSRIVAKTLG